MMMQIVDSDKVIDNISVFLKDLSRSCFYGTVEVSFVNGEPILVRKEETFKPVVFLK